MCLTAYLVKRIEIFCNFDFKQKPMKAKLLYFASLVLFMFFVFHLERSITQNYELRQLTKDKLKLEIKLLKIQIELNEINLQKEY